MLYIYNGYTERACFTLSLSSFEQQTQFKMGNAESGGGGGSDSCSSTSSSQCHGGGGFVVAHDGNAFTMSVDRDGGFSVSAAGREASSRDSISSDRYVANMIADRNAPVTEHTHTGSLAMSAAVDVMYGGGPDGTSMRHDAGHFHSHTHDPVTVGSVEFKSK